jgi:hypothetical protein
VNASTAYLMRKVAKFIIMGCQIARYNDDGWPSLFLIKDRTRKVMTSSTASSLKKQKGQRGQEHSFWPSLPFLLPVLVCL